MVTIQKVIERNALIEHAGCFYIIGQFACVYQHRTNGQVFWRFQFLNFFFNRFDDTTVNSFSIFYLTDVYCKTCVYQQVNLTGFFSECFFLKIWGRADDGFRRYIKLFNDHVEIIEHKIFKLKPHYGFPAKKALKRHKKGSDLFIEYMDHVW